jgi:hypothetical protein
MSRYYADDDDDGDRVLQDGEVLRVNFMDSYQRDVRDHFVRDHFVRDAVARHAAMLVHATRIFNQTF